MASEGGRHGADAHAFPPTGLHVSLGATPSDTLELAAHAHTEDVRGVVAVPLFMGHRAEEDETPETC